MKIHLLLLSLGLVVGACGCQAEKEVEVRAPTRAELTQKIAEVQNSSKMPPNIKADALKNLESQLQASK